MRPNRVLPGIALMAGFCFVAPLADGLAKLIGGAVPLLQVVTVRFLAQAVLLVPLVLLTGGTLRVPRPLVGPMALRTVLHVAGIALIFLALRFLPLADTIAIAYVMPFVVLLLGHLTMGEEVGWRRLGASVVGFAGTLLVMQPSFDEVGWIVALPVAVAVIFALFMLLTRVVAQRLDPLAIQAVNGLMGTALLLPLLLLAEGSGIAEADPIWPAARELWLLGALGFLGTFAHLLLTWSLRLAPASTLAPMQYLEIPFAVLVGWAMFAELPDGMALVGIVIVVGAGLYVLLRERAVARSAP